MNTKTPYDLSEIGFLVMTGVLTLAGIALALPLGVAVAVTLWKLIMVGAA